VPARCTTNWPALTSLKLDISGCYNSLPAASGAPRQNQGHGQATSTRPIPHRAPDLQRNWSRLLETWASRRSSSGGQRFQGRTASRGGRTWPERAGARPLDADPSTRLLPIFRRTSQHTARQRAPAWSSVPARTGVLGRSVILRSKTNAAQSRPRRFNRHAVHRAGRKANAQPARQASHLPERARQRHTGTVKSPGRSTA